MVIFVSVCLSERKVSDSRSGGLTLLCRICVYMNKIAHLLTESFEYPPRVSMIVPDCLGIGPQGSVRHKKKLRVYCAKIGIIAMIAPAGCSERTEWQSPVLVHL